MSGEYLDVGAGYCTFLGVERGAQKKKSDAPLIYIYIHDIILFSRLGYSTLNPIQHDSILIPI